VIGPALTDSGRITRLATGRTSRIQTIMNEGDRPIRAWLRTPAARAVALFTALSLVAAAAPARAQGRGIPVIRDAEIEQLLRDYTQPILRAAGLGQQNIRVVIINDRSFNAFVMDGRRIFINAGALIDAESPNQVIGVLAHEAGHIAGGHLSRLRQQLAMAQTQSILWPPRVPARRMRARRSSAPRRRSGARCCPTSARRRSRPTARA
jgi:predicted Zn-dependent protease